MSAVVGPREKRDGKWSCVVWCESCGDGARYSRTRQAEDWADSHNASRHLPELEAAAKAAKLVGPTD